MSRGTWKSSSSHESQGAVVGHCWKYTVGRGGRPGCRPWSCGDCAGVLPTPAGGVVVTVECSVLQMWHSVGPTGQGPAYFSSGGARDGPGPPWIKCWCAPLRRSEGCVEVPDPSRGEVRDSGCVCCASLLEGHVASPDPFLSRRRVGGHTRDEVESGWPKLVE